MKRKVMRVAASPVSLDLLLKGQLEFLNRHFDVTGVASPGPEHERIRKREGVETVELEIEREISLRKDLRSLWQLFCLFRRERPWLVHSLTPKAGLLSMTAAFLARVPVRIHTFTGLIFPYRRGAFRFLLKTMDRFTCLFASHIIPEGQGVKEQLERECVTRKPLSVIANGNVNGVDLAYFTRQDRRAEYRGRLGLSEETVLYIFIGRITGDKGIGELLEAFSRLKKAEAPSAPVALVLVGWAEGYPEESLRGEGIFCTGFQEDIRPWLEAADVFVLPSYREGFPNSLLQAGAMGLPAIATDICGCNEIIEDGVNGLLVPPADTESLWKAMSELKEDGDARDRMGRNAVRMAGERFDCHDVWQALLKYYQDKEE